ncbi:hypothetical protein CsSME_00004266 [Camellia sinensis var. sinensis]
MGDSSIEVMEENRDASQEAKEQGKLEEAIEQLTQAILLNPTSAIMYSGSIISIALAEVFFEEHYHDVKRCTTHFYTLVFLLSTEYKLFLSLVLVLVLVLDYIFLFYLMK